MYVINSVDIGKLKSNLKPSVLVIFQLNIFYCDKDNEYILQTFSAKI